MTVDHTVEIIPKIENGIVIDHIPAGLGPKLLEVIRATPGLETVVMSLGLNFASTRLGRKDMIKVHTGTLPERVVEHFSLIAPGITVKHVQDYAVDYKYVLTPPRVLRGLARCRNPNCLSNHEAGVESRFEVLVIGSIEANAGQAGPTEPPGGPRYRCAFCERVFTIRQLELLPVKHG